MSKDYKAYSTSTKKTGPAAKRKSRLGLWLLIVMGVIIIVGVMVWLSKHRADKSTTTLNSSEKISTKIVPVKTTPPVETPKAPEKPKIQFEFYNLLPKETVPPVNNNTTVAPPPKVKPSAPIISAAPIIDNSNTVTSVAAPAATASYVLQIASVKSVSDANAMKAKLAINGYPVQIKQFVVNGVVWYRVWVGPFDTSDAASNAQAKLKQQNIDSLLRKS